MKKILFAIIMLLALLPSGLSYSNDQTRERGLVKIMEKAIFCSVAYNYQLRFASIAIIIVPTNDPKVSVDALLNTATSWIVIVDTIQKTLKDDYKHRQKYLSTYKKEMLTALSGKISTDFLTLNPDVFIEKLYNSTKKCPALAIEARDLLKDPKNSTKPDRSKPHMPKRKM